MIDFDWKTVVKSVAPVLGTALGGPLAGVATRYIANEWLGDKNADEGDIALALQGASPDQIAALKRLDMEFATEMEKLRVQDLADARARDAALVSTRGNNYRADVLAFLAVAGLVLCVWFVARDTSMPERAVNAIMFISGILASAVKDVYAFEFGSSRGSKEKDNLISRLK